MNCYSEESFYATEISLETFCLAKWLNFFSYNHENKSKIKLNVNYFYPNLQPWPFFDDVRYVLWRWKG